jgi:hypothetical protein
MSRVSAFSRSVTSSARTLANVAWRVVLAIGLAEAGLAIGLVLLAVGLREVYPPASWIVPGLVLVWMNLPTRHRFVQPPPRPVRRRRREGEL